MVGMVPQCSTQCVFVCEREREREKVCVCERERERVCVCVCVCVCVRERERERQACLENIMLQYTDFDHAVRRCTPCIWHI